MAALLGAALLGMEGAFILSDVLGRYQQQQEKDIMRAAKRSERAQARNFGRQIALENQNMKRINGALDVGLAVNSIVANYDQMSPYQEVRMETSNFMAELANRNRSRLVALAQPTKPSRVESMLAQELANVTL